MVTGFTDPSRNLHAAIMCAAADHDIIARMTPRASLMPFREEEPQFVVLRWFTIVVLVAFLVPGVFAGYRAWVQVRSLAIRTSEAELRAGSVVAVDGVSWARTYVTMRLVLRQGDRADTLIVHQMGTYGVPSLDPRWRAESDSVVLGADRLAGFREGSALLVASAVGRPQWLRTPPPLVRELPVTLRTGAQPRRQ